MTMEYVSNYIDKKLYENCDLIKFTYFELRVKENLSEIDIETLLSLAAQRLSNKNYLIYKTGQQYTYNGESKIVADNELLIAIKQI